MHSSCPLCANSGHEAPQLYVSSSQGNAAVIWHAIHSAVGCVVTLIQTSSLRCNRMMTRAYSKSKPMVGTMSRSMAAMSGAWFRRKVPHPWLGGLGRWIMYFATLDWATSIPSLSNSP